jgi:Fe-S-cluster containining protein
VIEFVEIEHPRFRKVNRAIFLERVTPDCMGFECRLVKEGARVKLDACCQFGVDADLGERDAILAHASEIAALLRDEVRGLPWFADLEKEDPDFASGKFVRTTRHQDGCIFLAHDRRGCAIHRASVEGGWDFRGVKPHVCRLFPLSYGGDELHLSDDYEDYSCAFIGGAPTVYRAGREHLGDIFGAALVEALDAAEAAVVGPEALLRNAG